MLCKASPFAGKQVLEVRMHWDRKDVFEIKDREQFMSPGICAKGLCGFTTKGYIGTTALLMALRFYTNRYSPNGPSIARKYSVFPTTGVTRRFCKVMGVHLGGSHADCFEHHHSLSRHSSQANMVVDDFVPLCE